MREPEEKAFSILLDEHASASLHLKDAQERMTRARAALENFVDTVARVPAGTSEQHLDIPHFIRDHGRAKNMLPPEVLQPRFDAAGNRTDIRDPRLDPVAACLKRVDQTNREVMGDDTGRHPGDLLSDRINAENAG